MTPIFTANVHTAPAAANHSRTNSLIERYCMDGGRTRLTLCRLSSLIPAAYSYCARTRSSARLRTVLSDPRMLVPHPLLPDPIPLGFSHALPPTRVPENAARVQTQRIPLVTLRSRDRYFLLLRVALTALQLVTARLLPRFLVFSCTTAFSDELRRSDAPEYRQRDQARRGRLQLEAWLNRRINGARSSLGRAGRQPTRICVRRRNIQDICVTVGRLQARKHSRRWVAADETPQLGVI